MCCEQVKKHKQRTRSFAYLLIYKSSWSQTAKPARSATLGIETRVAQLHSRESDISVKGHAEQVVLTTMRRNIVVFQQQKQHGCISEFSCE